MSLSAMSMHFLNTSRNGDSTTALDSPFQRLTSVVRCGGRLSCDYEENLDFLWMLAIQRHINKVLEHKSVRMLLQGPQGKSLCPMVLLA